MIMIYNRQITTLVTYIYYLKVYVNVTFVVAENCQLCAQW